MRAFATGGALGLLFLIAVPGPAAGQPVERTVTVVRPDFLQWTSGGDGEVDFAMLTGNPRKEGPFAFRMRMPAGWAMQPHEHDRVEHITVLNGTLEMRIGRDQPRVRLPPGTFVSIPPGAPMWAWTGDEPVVIQVHGTGPFGTIPVE